jgi:hypothetical protein
LITQSLSNQPATLSPVVISKTLSSSPQTLNWSNLGTGRVDEYRVTLASNVTLTFTGARDGQYCLITVKQDGTGGRLITWGSETDFTQIGGTPTLSTTPSTEDIFLFVYDLPNNEYRCILVRATAASNELALPMCNIPGFYPEDIRIRLATTEALEFAANFSGSVALARSASTGTVTIVINKIVSAVTTAIGSITFTSSATGVFASTGGLAQSIVAGGIIEFLFPHVVDATLEDVSLSVRGTIV